jgi:hypothetical protein
MPTNQELESICKIAGMPMFPWAITQLKKRSEQGSQQNRSDDNLQYLANKGAWIRVVSSVNIEEKLQKYFKDSYQIGLANDRSLAESFILYGGTSTFAFKSQQLNAQALGINNLEIGDVTGNRTQGMNLRSGLDAYSMVGDREIQSYGYRPMPGITSATVEATGRLGSLRQATVNFKVWDKYQLDIMDALYCRPGFTVLIEWGHAKYYDNNGNLQSSEQYMMNPFKAGLTKEDIQIQLNVNAQRSAGNYGGMLGLITNFNFSMTPDGGYDCTIKALALGSILGSFPINHAAVLPDTYYEQLTKYLNNERNQEILRARQEAELLAAKQVGEFDASLDEKSRAVLAIADDKYGTLLYNSGILENDINNFIGGSINETIGQQRQQQEALNFAQDVIKEEKAKSIVLFSSTDGNTAAYYNESPKDRNILYLDNPANLNVHERYITNSGRLIAANETQSDKIIVKLDRDKLREAVESIDPAKTKFFQGAENAKYYYNLVVGNDRQNRYNVVIFRYPQQTTIANGVNTVVGADQAFDVIKNDVFLNLNAQYKVIDIRSNVYLKTGDAAAQKAVYVKLQYKFDPRYTVELGLPISDSGDQERFFESVGKVTYTSLADLSLIASVEGDQSLTINKVGTDRQQALSDAERAKQDYLSSQSRSVDDRYNAEQLKTTIQGESTIELMLRSLMLYAIDNPKQYNKKKRDRYIASLFSEGAYKNIFSNGIPGEKKYTYDDLKKYVDGSMTAAARLEMNMRYGNNFYLMSCRNVLDDAGNVKQDFLESLPQVDFETLFRMVTIKYGKTADLEVANRPDASVYINLGLFFLMLNHTGILYNKETIESLSENDTITPMAYLDFNPETNYYLSSENQVSINPYKFLVRFSSDREKYRNLFDKDLVKNGVISYKAKNYVEGEDAPKEVTVTEKLFDPKSDIVSRWLPDTKTGVKSVTANGYIGKLMYVQVEINYLLDIMRDYRTSSDSHEVYFQSVIERIINDLNKNMGYYNAFRFSYDDFANCYVITDDQLQSKPLPGLGSIRSAIIENPQYFEIPVYGSGSIARGFDLNTDISSRLASYLAISSNPGAETQVVTSKNTTDVGIYNTGSYDRYIPRKVDGTATPNKSNIQNAQAAELAVNFNSVISKIYTVSRPTVAPEESTTEVQNISDSDIDRALGYYIDRMAKVKNAQEDTAHAMIIPLATRVTMDGMSGVYPFQLFTIDERMLPYRYSRTALNQRMPAFTITKITNNFENNQWTTSLEGKMTLVKNESKTGDQPLGVQSATVPESGVSAVTSGYSNIKFEGSAKLEESRINPVLLANIEAAAKKVNAVVTITTALTHDETTSAGYPSRHVKGNAVDISIINGQSVLSLSTKTGTVADLFVLELYNMGYRDREQSLNENAVLYKVDGHRDHIHVSKGI